MGDVTALRIVRLGRFGNNWRQLLSAIIFARLYGITTIHVLSNFLHIQTPFQLSDGIVVRPSLRLFHFRRDVLRSQFWVCYKTSFCPFLRGESIADEVRDFILGGYPRREIDHSTLYLHMRGGDIWTGAGGRYAQPPCQFYVDVMSRYGGNGTVVLTQDRGNVCLDVVLGKGAKWQVRSFEEDLALAIYAEKIALGVSTLSAGFLQLSPIRKTFFVSEEPVVTWNRDAVLCPYSSYREFGRFERCRVSSEFQEKVIERWGPTEEQKRLILAEKCSWEVVEANASLV
jgi:hypothetical protein